MGMIGDYSWGIGAKRISYMGAKFAVSWITSAAIAPILARYGITIDSAKMQLELTAAGMMLMEAIHDWLKVKYPIIAWL